MAGTVLMAFVSLVGVLHSLSLIRDRAEAKKRGDRNIHGGVEFAPLVLVMWLASLVYAVVRLVTG